MLNSCKGLPDECWLADWSTPNGMTGRLDLCSVQGVSGGKQVPQIAALVEPLPKGFCRVDADCGSADLKCSKDDSFVKQYCTCSGGQDACENLGRYGCAVMACYGM
jgi:hypothetical protein